MTSDRTYATCPGAVFGECLMLLSVKMALVVDLSSDWSRDGLAALLQKCLRSVIAGDSDALVTSASEPIPTASSWKPGEHGLESGTRPSRGSEPTWSC